MRGLTKLKRQLFRFPHPSPLESGSELRSTSSIPEGEGVKCGSSECG